MVSIMKIEPDTDLPFHPGDLVLYIPTGRVVGLPATAPTHGVVGRVIRPVGTTLLMVEFGTRSKPNRMIVRADHCHEL